MALDLSNTKEVYTAMFGGKDRKTLTDVWNALADIVKADTAAFTVENERTEENVLTISTARGTLKFMSGQEAGKINITSTAKDAKGEENATVATAADTLIDFIQRNRSIAQTSGAQVLRR